jgi:hypothetical protein
MSTVTIVVVGIWNGLLLISLALVLKHWKRILPWITGLDRVDRDEWDRGDEDKWTAFLTDHPELSPRRSRTR